MRAALYLAGAALVCYAVFSTVMLFVHLGQAQTAMVQQVSGWK